jgi:hypothetical protein
VTAGTDVVTPALVDAARWETITDSAAAFAAAVVNTASGASA